MSAILVVNSGSSSIKYQVIDSETEERITQGLVERIGESGSGVPDHSAAFAGIISEFEEAGTPLESLGIVAVGHRVVHGGGDFIAPVIIDDKVAARILELSALAPLHNPGHHAAITAARAVFPSLPHVAVFDTAFHQTMPERAYTYAIPQAVAAEYGIRRYGFHGISHAFVSRRAATVLGRPVEELKQVVLHLGNGASMCAVDGGQSVDTSMGMTPLEGLVMGSRSGDIDPGAILHLLRQGETVDSVDALLNQRSGFLGFAGSNDLRDVRAAAQSGGEAARLAIDVYVHRIHHYLGAYLAVLGGADAIVFTAGLGENAPDLRARVCEGFEWCGVKVDPELNEAPAPSGSGARVISAPESSIAVLVVPTDEEVEIARQTLEVVRGA